MDESASFCPPHSPYFDLSHSVMRIQCDGSPSPLASPAMMAPALELKNQGCPVEDPLHAHLRAVLGEEYWNPQQNHLLSWWSKFLKPFSSETRRRNDRKARSCGKDESLVTAATSPTASMDNSAHSNCVRSRTDTVSYREPIGVHLQPRPRRHGQEDLCSFLNLLTVNYHENQHPADPLILISEEKTGVPLPMDPESKEHHGVSTLLNTSHSLRRVHNIHDMSLQAGSNKDSASLYSDRPRSVSELTLASDTELSIPTLKRMASSPAVPLPNAKAISVADGSSPEDESKAMAEYIYTKATWRMYDRIMSARIKAEEARRKSLSYHSLPPVCKVGREHNSSIPPTFPKSLRTTYTIDENSAMDSHHDPDCDINNSNLAPGSLETAFPDPSKATTHVDLFDHDNPVFSLDLDS